jgi:lysyl-tRNA synthetase class 2
LKRLVVGGLDRVYEINRNFRNEGIDRTHNPEFTMLEFYQAYANYHDLMDLTQELIQFVAMEINGTTLTTFNSTTIELKTHNWTRLSMREAIIKHWSGALGTAPKMQDFASSDQLTAWLQRTQNEPPEHPMEMFAFPGVSPASYIHAVQTTIAECLSNLSKGEAYGKSIAAIFEAVSEPFLNQPHIIYDFPLAVSPLSKIKPDEPDWTERFEFYIGGMEIGNAFSELNDPDDQLRRFAAQVADKEPESMAAIDYDYVRALGYGLPPTAGEGIGIDRLTMILTGSRTIRDVILFPLMRPAKATEPPPTEGKDS